MQAQCQYPEEMLDSNLSTDREKIAYCRAAQWRSDYPAALNEQEPLALFKLAERFGVYDLYHRAQDHRFMVSLLAYLGVLTLVDHRSEVGELRFAHSRMKYTATLS